MNIEEKLIVSLLRSVILEEKQFSWLQEFKTSIAWDRFKDLVSYHEIQSLLYPFVLGSESLFPSDIVNFLKNNYFYNLINNQRFLEEFSSISASFRQAKIPIVPIKGVALLKDICAHIPSRPMADMDLLVEKVNLPRARTILSGLSFTERLEGLSESYWLEKQCHVPFLKTKSDRDIIALDLHFGLDFKRKKGEILPQLWSRACSGTLSPEDALFSLALHQRRFGKSLCLKNVVDTVLILRKYQDLFDWDYVIKQAKLGRMCSTMFFLLAQVKNLFDSETHMPQLNVLCPSHFKRKLISSFIKKNVFIDSSARKANELYLKSHFLLYDDFFEPIKYILNIPQEQFAKFYKLQPYSKRTVFFYDNRILYILYKLILS
jgi:hypothetical protein